MIGGYVPPQVMLFFDSFSLFDLRQGVKDGTFVDSNNILIWCSPQDCKCVYTEAFPKCHHSSVVFEYVLHW